MTTDELKRLAEIAGLEHYDFAGVLCYVYDKVIHADGSVAKLEAAWRPDIRIEQAMMVADGLRKIGICYILKGSFFTDGIEVELHHVSKGKLLWKFGATPALAICRAALAAKE